MAAPPTPSRPDGHPRRWLILALVLCAECMDLLDGTIVNVAAPTIRHDLHTTSTGLEWVIGGYGLTFAIGLITGGRLGDIFGRRRLFVLGACGFVAASAACGLAVSPEMLIGCRLAQGFASSLLIPQGLGIILDAFPSEEQGQAFGLFGPVIGLSAVLGPIIGGALIAANAFGTSWRLIFFVNLPIGLAAAIGGALVMPESRAQRRPRLDLIGTVIAAAAMGLLVYPLIQGRTAGWPAWTFAMIGGSVACLVAFLGWTRIARRRGHDPLVEASIFGHRGYSTGIASVIVFFAGMIGTLLVLSLFLQFGERFSPIHTGLTLAPFAFGTACGAVLAATVTAPRLGRRALQLAAIVMAGGFFWLRQVFSAHGLHTTSLDLIAPQLLVGLGIGGLVSPLFDFILASVTDAETGSASGVLNAMQQLAGAIGVAVIGTIFFSVLGHEGFVAAVDRCLLIELATTPALFVLTGMLPAWAREPQPAPQAGADPGGVSRPQGHPTSKSSGTRGDLLVGHPKRAPYEQIG